MNRLGMVFVFVGLFALWGGVACRGAVAQEFPYAVPQAPEFDSNGSPVDSSQSEPAPPPAPRKRSPHPYQSPEQTGVDPRAARPNPQASPSWGKHRQRESAVDYRAVRPYVSPEAPPPRRVRQPPAPAQAYPPPGVPGPAMASTPPQAQMQGVPDCSQYPMMIAQAQSEPERQMVARQFLTCLLRSGWTMEQAKNHVISTYETSRMGQ
jgi:hypothetical protein